MVGPYEHHSNILPWVESGAKVYTIKQTNSGMIDLDDLERKLMVSDTTLTMTAMLRHDRP